MTSTAVQPRLDTHFGRTLWMEWTKLRTVRSTILSLLGTAAVCVGFAILLSYGIVSRWDRTPAQRKAGFHPATFSVSGILFAQLVIGALGVLAITAEYSTGTIRASLSAVPQRITLLVSKTLVFAATALAVCVAATITSFVVGQQILADKNIQTHLSAPGVPRVVLGAALFLVAVGLLGLGLGAILRHSAGAISTLFGVMLVLPLLGNFLPSDWQDHINKYLPLNAGTVVMEQVPDAGSLAPWTGLALMYGYAVAALVIGGIVLARRDA